MERMFSASQPHRIYDSEEQLDSFLEVLGKIRRYANIEGHHQSAVGSGGGEGERGAGGLGGSGKDYGTEYYKVMKMRQVLRRKEDLITYTFN